MATGTTDKKTSSTKKTAIKSDTVTPSKSSTKAKNSSTSKTSSKKKTTSPIEKKANATVSEKISEATGIKKSVVSKEVRKVGKLSTGGKIAVGISLIAGIAIGYFGIKIIQKNDQFKLIHGETLSVNVGEEVDFTDLSKYVKCISYGMNSINSVSIEGLSNNKLDTTSEKEYKITYTSTNLKYRNIKLTQTIYVVNSENSYEDQ